VFQNSVISVQAPFEVEVGLLLAWVHVIVAGPAKCYRMYC